MVESYPLQWPAGYPRTPETQRKHGQFNKKERVDGRSWMSTRDLTIADAVARLLREIERIGALLPVVSTNIEPRLDGLPRADQRKLTDPGVAVYFQHKGRSVSLPCDRYMTVADNIAAIAAHIGATRAIERHGVGTVEQMFAGFTAIRGPGPKPWRETLGIPPDLRVGPENVRARVRELAMKHHPDRGGDVALMAEINAAGDRAIQELSDAQ